MYDSMHGKPWVAIEFASVYPEYSDAHKAMGSDPVLNALRAGGFVSILHIPVVTGYIPIRERTGFTYKEFYSFNPENNKHEWSRHVSRHNIIKAKQQKEFRVAITKELADLESGRTDVRLSVIDKMRLVFSDALSGDGIDPLKNIAEHRYGMIDVLAVDPDLLTTYETCDESSFFT